MFKKIILAVIILLPFCVKAQVSLNVQLPPGGYVQKEQLWNLVLVSNNTDIIDVNVQLNLQDALTGQVVMSASTNNILLTKGVKVLKSNDLLPITYNYNVADFSKNYIPMGSYIACYQVINNSNRKETPMVEECIRINIDALSPPLLNSPTDKAEIETPYPQFSWMPPTPFEMFSNLTYDLLITDILEGQSSTEAIQYNTPIYTKNNISQPYESYATSFKKLDTGKVYAWQVIAKNGTNYAAKTEIWTFKITNAPALTKITSITYISLGDDDTKLGSYNLKDDKVNIKYHSYHKAFEATIKIKTTTGEVVQELKQSILNGDNFFNIILNKTIIKEKQYIIVLEENENILHKASFSINNK